LEAGGHAFNPPLLPYEKELIEVLGCTEEDYRKLMRFSELKPRVRPAEYDHIPEVVNDPVTIIINLVIGIALSAVGALLAPKPELPSQDRIKRQRLSNQIGPSRFNQTSGFDGVGALVEYGDEVPIPFGKMGVGADGGLSGGLVLAAALVWSRLYSLGNFQRYKALYSMGEYGIKAPQLRAIWMGTTALSSLGSHDFAVYWKSQQGSNRITGSDLIAGTRGQPISGDPEPQHETFIAPVEGAYEAGGFCMAYNPNSKFKFGQYNPVRNGTAHRFNWEVVSLPEQLREDDEDMRRAKSLRRKISGSNADRPLGGQPGVGRAYGTQMGLIAHNGNVVQNKVPELYVNAGDTVTFRIHNSKYKDLRDNDALGIVPPATPLNMPKYGHNFKDLRGSIDTMRQRADDLMVVGSRWMIGSTQWIVESRTADVWKPGTIVDVVLKCVSTTGINKIGLAGFRASTEDLGGYEGPWTWDDNPPAPLNSEGFNPLKHCGAAFWNLVQYDVATVRMVRPVDTIEFGIRSTVWNRANGLCNFNAIPDPTQLKQRDDNNRELNTPVMNKYFPRTSCFSVWVRPIPKYGNDPLPEWDRIDQVFCVTGQSPTAKYNFLRIRPRVAGRYEFRFIPRVGSDIAINSWEDAVFWRLNAQSGEVHGKDFDTAYGAFRVTMVGDLITCAAIKPNTEMVTDPSDVTSTVENSNKPNGISELYWTTSTGGTDWQINAFLTQLLGDAAAYAGQTRSAEFTHFKPRSASTTDDDGYLRIRVTATSNTVSGPRHAQIFGTNWNWSGSGAGVHYWIQAVPESSETRGLWAQGDQMELRQTITSNNKYSILGYSYVGVGMQVTSVVTIISGGGIDLDRNERAFELASQVSDCSHYEELEKSCDNGPEHEIVYVNEAVAEYDGLPQYDDMSMLGLVIKSNQTLTSVEQIRAWVDEGIPVERLEANTFGPSNLFSDLVYYLITNKKQGVGQIVPPELVDRQSFATTGRFLLQNKIFWNGVIESQENFRSFVNRMAQLSLCTFTIKNGVFGLMPALPHDSSGAINTSTISVAQLFSAGNIIDGSFKLSYLDNEARRDVALAVRWRVMRPYELPDEDSAVVAFADRPLPPTIEELDLTMFCDNRAQALKTARFILASRRYVDHSITFKTVPNALGIEPGSYIKVVLEEIEFQTGRNLAIAADGHLSATEHVDDGTYQAFIYKPGAEDVEKVSLTIANDTVVEEEYRGAVASLLDVSFSHGIYQVEQITLDEDGLVDVSAVAVPSENDASKVAQLTLNEGAFTYDY
jgi:hypothetical protein